MTTMISKMLVAAVTTATFAMGATATKADHYVRSCGDSYTSYAPSYYTPVYAPAPVVYTAPVYSYVPYRPITYVRQPVFYPRYYAPAPVYRTHYAPSSFGFGFGHGRGGHFVSGGYRGGHYGGGFGFGYSRGGHYGGFRGGHHGGGFSFHGRH